MILRDLFSKPVDRPIEGVIKADDEASLKLEVEEYILTNEVEKRLEAFLDAYVNYSGANGVWISGFFGSGKSHLLKILALLLESRVIDGVPILEIFLPKCRDNEILRGDLERACRIPSRSILFNIDQKADVISKTQLDALVAVFVKVFDEMCGYYGKQPYIAQMERDLDRDGLFAKFKAAFLTISGNDWEWGRSRTKRLASQIDEAYAKVTGQAVSGILDKYRSDYRLSIEDFADQVNRYIERQEKGFRLNFFVDEVGQYIANNVKLMTNLQTIAESLATKSRGRAWVIVTAQEDMDSVIGEMTQKQGNDFTKIMARFANRLKLTSADVAEVIQKRLLTKNDKGITLLTGVYHDQVNNFNTLFGFADGSINYRNFQDRDHFIHAYPFIPYQFSLFQASIQGLSAHSAFEGKHSSVGERSMLAVFQQVAKQISDHELGQLATFDLMFEGIRTALKAGIQRSVLVAENNLDSPFAIRVLKALFLVKYVKEFKATQLNICVLMLESFQQNVTELRKSVVEALNVLEQQTYIQRNGDIYSYLTDEEQDVQKEIVSTEVDAQEVSNELEKLIFDTMLKTKKIRHDASGNDYPFSRRLDDRLFGREYELAVNFITPFHEHSGKEAVLKTQSMARDEVMVVLPQDDLLLRDVVMYKKTEKYIRLNYSNTQQEAVKRILDAKSGQNTDRYRQIQQHVHLLTGKAKIFIQGSELDTGSEDPNVRVTKGFHDLVTRAYPNLNMLQGISYSENDITKYLKRKLNSLMDTDSVSLSEAEQEVFAHIQSNARIGVRSTVKSLVDAFEKKPYGWSLATIQCMVAKLLARGKVICKTDSEPLEEHALERALRNTQGHANVILEPQVEFTPAQVRQLKDFFNEFFDRSPSANEPKALGQECLVALKTYLQDTLLPLAQQTSQYPFLVSLVPVTDKLKGIVSKPYSWFLTEFSKEADFLLDAKEEVIDPIIKFMNGPQRAIFDEAQAFLRHQEPNLTYVDGDIEQIMTSLADPKCFKGSAMQEVKALLGDLQRKVTTTLQDERSKAVQALEVLQSKLHCASEYAALTPERQAELNAPFANTITEIGKNGLIAMIEGAVRRFEDVEYSRLLSKMAEWSTPVKIPEYDPEKPGEAKPHIVAEPKVEYVSSRSVQVPFKKPWLADASDVEEYLNSMRKALLDEIAKGKRVQV